MEAAFAGGTIAKEAGDDAGPSLHRLGQGDAGGEREFATDDGGGQHDSEFLDGNVQRSAPALAVAVAPTHHFSQQATGVGTACQQMAGAAVVGQDQIVGSEGVDGADRGGFLADRGAGAGNAPVGAALDDGVFVSADQQQLFIQPERIGGGWEFVHGDSCHGDDGSLGGQKWRTRGAGPAYESFKKC